MTVTNHTRVWSLVMFPLNVKCVVTLSSVRPDYMLVVILLLDVSMTTPTLLILVIQRHWRSISPLSVVLLTEETPQKVITQELRDVTDSAAVKLPAIPQHPSHTSLSSGCWKRPSKPTDPCRFGAPRGVHSHTSWWTISVIWQWPSRRLNPFILLWISPVDPRNIIGLVLWWNIQSGTWFVLPAIHHSCYGQWPHSSLCLRSSSQQAASHIWDTSPWPQPGAVNMFNYDWFWGSIQKYTTGDIPWRYHTRTLLPSLSGHLPKGSKHWISARVPDQRGPEPQDTHASCSCLCASRWNCWVSWASGWLCRTKPSLFLIILNTPTLVDSNAVAATIHHSRTMPSTYQQPCWRLALISM